MGRGTFTATEQLPIAADANGYARDYLWSYLEGGIDECVEKEWSYKAVTFSVAYLSYTFFFTIFLPFARAFLLTFIHFRPCQVRPEYHVAGHCYPVAVCAGTLRR